MYGIMEPWICAKLYRRPAVSNAANLSSHTLMLSREKERELQLGIIRVTRIRLKTMSNCLTNFQIFNLGFEFKVVLFLH